MRSIMIAIFLLFTSVSIAWANLPPAKEPIPNNGTTPCGTLPSCGTIPQATPTEDVSDPPTSTPTVTPTVTPTETSIPTRAPIATGTPVAPTVYKTYLPIVSKN